MIYVKCTAQSLAWENVVIISLQIPRVLFEVYACKVLFSESKFPTTVLTSSTPPCGNVVLSGVFSPYCSRCKHSLNIMQKFSVFQSSWSALKTVIQLILTKSDEFKIIPVSRAINFSCWMRQLVLDSCSHMKLDCFV